MELIPFNVTALGVLDDNVFLNLVFRDLFFFRKSGFTALISSLANYHCFFLQQILFASLVCGNPFPFLA